MPKSRKEWVIISIVPFLFAAMLWGVIALQMSEINQFRREGIETSATVVDKYTRMSSSTDSDDHYLVVTYMAKDGRSAEDGFGGESTGLIDVGTFTRTDFETGGRTYRDTNIGDNVRIYYLASDTSEALLKERVDTFNPIFLWVLVWLLVAGGAYCLIRAAIFSPKL